MRVTGAIHGDHAGLLRPGASARLHPWMQDALTAAVAAGAGVYVDLIRGVTPVESGALQRSTAPVITMRGDTARLDLVQPATTKPTRRSSRWAGRYYVQWVLHGHHLRNGAWWPGEEYTAPLRPAFAAATEQIAARSTTLFRSLLRGA